MECGSLLPLSARLLAGALGAGSKLPAQKAGASSRTPNRHDFDGTLRQRSPRLDRFGARQAPYNGIAPEGIENKGRRKWSRQEFCG